MKITYWPGAARMERALGKTEGDVFFQIPCQPEINLKYNSTILHALDRLNPGKMDVQIRCEKQQDLLPFMMLMMECAVS